MNGNAKNELLELLKDIGCNEDYADFSTQLSTSTAIWESTVVVRLPGGRRVKGTGRSTRKSDAEISASQSVIETVRNDCPDLPVDWESIKVEAQAGDALIKLGIYLSTETKSASDNSQKLQELESDLQLAKVFDQWKAQGDSELAKWGTNLGEKRKATLVEALVWRRVGMRVMAASALEQLQNLVKTLTVR